MLTNNTVSKIWLEPSSLLQEMILHAKVEQEGIK